MKTVLAIDPGPEKSAFVLFEDSRVLACAQDVENDKLRKDIYGEPLNPNWQFDFIALEMVACYGMAVGAETFETCRWIGRFEEASLVPVRLVYRKDVKMHLCHSMRAKDANIRQALIDKHGPLGTKKNPGKLYGVSGHCWAALAVADYALEFLKGLAE